MRTLTLIGSLIIGAVCGVVSATPTPSSPSLAVEDRPDGTLRLSEGRISTGVVYMWGRGTLTFQDRRHDFRISGPPVADVAALTLSATGRVYHLTRLSDFSGRYVAVDSAAVPAGATDIVPIRNEHGVVIMLHVAAAGIQRARAAGGVSIQLKEQAAM